MHQDGAAGTPLELQRQLQELCELPLELSTAKEGHILRTAARKLLQVLPELGYVRIQLNQGGATATDMLEMCGDAGLAAAMAALPPPSTALAASGRSEAPILAPGLPAGASGYTDLQLLADRGSMRCAAAVPLLMAGSPVGAALLASPMPGYLGSRSTGVLECWAAMLAPYAGMAHKAAALTGMRPVLGSLLPPRVAQQVVAAAADSRPFLDMAL